MALYTSLVPIAANEVRDVSSEEPAVLMLDGNTTDGRLNSGLGAVFTLPDDSRVEYTGACNHSFMKGTIIAKRLTMVASATSGRVDFSGPDGGFQAEDLTYVYANDSGSVFNHLENEKNIFTGFTRFIFRMGGGDGYVQFANREYPNVGLVASQYNRGNVHIYPARSHAGHTSLPGFNTDGFTSLGLLRGATTTSHAHIYDPEYKGTEDNLLPMQVDTTAAGNNCIEYFTLDVTNIRDDLARLRAIDEDGKVLFDDYLTADKATIKDYSGVPLRYYDARSAIPCEVRRIGGTMSTTRKQISYRVRQAGFEFIDAPLFDMNAPVSIALWKQDLIYVADHQAVDVDKTSKTLTATANVTTQQLYSALQDAAANDLSLEVDWSITGTELDINDWTVTANVSATGMIDTVRSTTVAGTAGSAVFIDSNGDSILFESNGYSFSVFASQQARDNTESALAENVDSWRFVYANTAPVLYLWVFVDGVEMKAKIDIAQGVNQLDLGVAGAITSLSQKIEKTLTPTID